MARPRKFNESDVVAVSMALFAKKGFNATSIDDLVAATGLLRGSLYKAFGSKLNIFLLGFRQCADHFDATSAHHLDVITVALRDLAPEDEATRAICNEIISKTPTTISNDLGINLLKRLEK